MEFVKVENISKSFNNHKVLDNISFSSDNFDSLLIIGRSGVGKSVFLKTCVRLIEPDEGKIFINGIDVLSLNESELEEFRKDIGVLFQNGALFDFMNVEENILFVLENVRGISGQEALNKAKEVLEMVGLPDVLKKMPSELSGGMRKRVALARTISTDPKILFLDEPTTGLDPITSDYVVSSIVELRNLLKVPLVVITHDIEVMKKIRGKVILIYKGKVVFDGSLEKMFSDGNEFTKQFLSGSSYGPISVI
ncbi:MAG: ABC transporter ATP-binding protein [Brevinematia bacterium]